MDQSDAELFAAVDAALAKHPFRDRLAATFGAWREEYGELPCSENAEAMIDCALDYSDPDDA